MLQQFAAAFDDAIVSRFDDDRNVTDKIKVRYIVGPKQRVLAYLADPAQNLQLPVVAVLLNSITRDPNRVFNKIVGSNFAIGAGNIKTQDGTLLQPVPVNLSVSVSLLTKYQTDYEQIITNFVPYCDPYFVISWALPGVPNQELRSEVEWSGQITINIPLEATSTTQWQFGCETTFTIKGWLFKNDANTVGKIFKIDTNFKSTKEIGSVDEMSIGNTESFSVSGMPLIDFANKSLIPANSDANLVLYGNSLGYPNVTQMFISGSNIPSMSAYDETGIFLGTQTDVPVLSAIEGAFYGAPVNFNINSLNSLTMYTTMTDGISAGYIDIIVTNPAGYSILTRDTFNPNLSTQFPYVSGIEVVNV